MGISRRIFTRQFKVAAVKEVDSGKSVAYVARRLEINPNLLHRWRQDLKRNPSTAFSGNGKRMLAESREAELERKIGQLTMENDFLKKLVVVFEEQQEADGGGRPSSRRSRKKPNR